MSDTRNGSGLGARLGLVLFGVGSFLGVLAIMALVKGVPETGGSGTMALARRMVDAVGTFPALVFAGGTAALGATLFLADRVRGPGRHLAGVVGAATGLAVLLGSVSAQSGGSLGAMTGGALSASLHPIVGFLFGMVALALPVWFAWVHDGQGRSILGRFARLSITRGPEAASDGVTPAEAAALFPEAAAPPTPPLTSPYPEDVRLRGQIPQGTKPLVADEDQADVEAEAETADERAEVPPADFERPSSVVRWTPGSVEDVEDEIDADAQAETMPFTGFDEPDVLEPRERTPDALPEGVTLLFEASTELPLDEIVAEDVSATGVPRPSWESSDVEDVSDEVAESVEEPVAVGTPPDGGEPVDAYGTPRDLADSLAAALATRPADMPHVGEETRVLQPLGRVVTDLEPGDVEADLEETEIETTAAVVQPDVEDDEEEALEDDEVYAESDEEEADDEEYEYEDDEEYEYDDDDEVEGEALEDEETFAESDDEEYAYEDEAEEEPVATLEGAAEAEVREDEPQVVLTPQAAPTTASPRTARVLEDPDLVFEAGCLFLEEGRVAVSMLQRQFELDFDQSCVLLDKLQDLGLIGPYLGGQRRDILMTLDEWMEKVTAP